MEDFYHPSPGLDLGHGFLHVIRKNQVERLQHEREVSQQKELMKNRPVIRDTKKHRPDKMLYTVTARRSESQPSLDVNSELLNQINDELVNSMDLSVADIDLGNYVVELQESLLKAIKDPSSLPDAELRNVAGVIVNRAYEDPNYYKTAAMLCQHISQKEVETQSQSMIPNYKFTRSVMENCQLLMEDHIDMRQANVTYWINFVYFLAEIYVQLTIGRERMKAIWIVLYSALNVLAKSACKENFEEAELLTSVLRDVGSALDSDDSSLMDELLCNIRDSFLEPMTEPAVRTMLLQVIELRASQWTLPKSAEMFHFQ